METKGTVWRTVHVKTAEEFEKTIKAIWTEALMRENGMSSEEARAFIAACGEKAEQRQKGLPGDLQTKNGDEKHEQKSK